MGDVKRSDFVTIAESGLETAPALIVSEAVSQPLVGFGHRLEGDDPAAVAEPSQALGELPSIRADVERAVDRLIVEHRLDVPVESRGCGMSTELDTEKPRAPFRDRQQ